MSEHCKSCSSAEAKSTARKPADGRRTISLDKIKKFMARKSTKNSGDEPKGKSQSISDDSQSSSRKVCKPRQMSEPPRTPESGYVVGKKSTGSIKGDSLEQDKATPASKLKQHSGDSEQDRTVSSCSLPLHSLPIPPKAKKSGKSYSESATKTNPTETTTTSSYVTQTCPICKGIYGSVSIGIHIRACQALSELRYEKLIAQKAWDSRLMRRPSHPPGTICFICGRRYTHASWDLHIPRCLQKWLLWNSLLPKDKRHKRRPVTPEPTEDEISRRIEEAHQRGLTYYIREDAVDDIMREESDRNRLPLELIC
ncbi:unnamed protein product [Calicophoron daubneyi]|uniref:Uncharacterized protein n=1 Tax=Calicophoron daubneyi TaxID=300641 RepID=A0AAV2THK3_CALDB